MPEIVAFADQLRGSVGGPVAAVIGGLLLLFGRRLYWLAAGVVGFVAVFLLAQRFLPELSQGALWLVSVAVGIVGAVLVVFAHRILLGIVGGLGGGLIGLWQAQHFGLESGVPWLIAALVGGLLGAWLVSRLFEFALILLSSLLGAQLLLDVIVEPAGWFVPAYFGLVIFGVLFQMSRSRKRQRKRKKAD